MVEPDFLKFDTLSLHAGQAPDPTTGARAVPIYQTTSYSFTDTVQAAGLFNLEIPGHLYSRISNPTVAVLEERLAALEGGVGAVCTASGMAAVAASLLCHLKAGDHVVSARALFGSCRYVVEDLLPRYGITSTLIDGRDLAAWEAAVQSNTRAFFFETPTNPVLELVDIEAVTAIASRSLFK